MTEFRPNLIAWMFAAFLALSFSILQANNPDGSHPVWQGQFGEQVDMYSGELSLSVTDVSIPTRGGIPLSFTRSYSSELYQSIPRDSIYSNCYDLAGTGTAFKPFGWGWHLPVVRIANDNIYYSDGQYEPFFRDAKNRQRTRSFAARISGGSATLRFPNGTTWIFGDSAILGGGAFDGFYLKRVTDHTAKNFVDYTYATSSNDNAAGGLLVKMEDQSGRFIKIFYNSLSNLQTARIDSVVYKGTGGANRCVKYTYNADGLLASVEYPDGRTVTYTYTDLMYCGGSQIYVPGGAQLLASITIASGGKAKYTFERFSEKLIDSPGTSNKFVAHFAIRSIDLDSSGTSYNYASFVRDQSGIDNLFTSQVKIICDSCASTEREVHSWNFMPKWVNHDFASEVSNNDRYAKSGLVREYDHFRSTTSCSGICSPNESGDSLWLHYSYDSYYLDPHGGYELVQIGRDYRAGAVDTAVWYPFLKGYKRKLPHGSLEWMLQDAQMNPYVGVTTSYKAVNDSTFQILSATYDTTNHMYYVKRTRFNGIDDLFEYDETGSIPNNPQYRKRYLISGSDDIETSFDYDTVGNVIMVYDDLGQASASIQYEATLTYPFVTTSRLELVDTSNYDIWTGNILSSVSPNGTRKEFEYDGADRLIRARRVGDTCDNLRRYYASDHRSIVDSILIDSSPCRYRIERSSYTIFNQLWQVKVDSINSRLTPTNYSTSVVDYEYNRMLQLKRRSIPHWSHQNYSDNKWTEYRYDYAGRVVREDLPNTTNDDGSTSLNSSLYAYRNYDEIQYDWLGRRGTKRFDRMGRLVWTEFEDSSASGDFADTTTLNYLGNTAWPSSIVMPGSRTNSYTYDQFRRPRTITKTNEGTDSLFYDKLGNLKFKRDARGIWTSFKYDLLYRLIEVRTATTVARDSVNSLTYMPSGTSRASYVYGHYDFVAAADSLIAHYGTGYNSHSWIKGMLTQVNDEACTTLFMYDRQGRVAKKYIHFNPVDKWPGTTVGTGFKMISYKYSPSDAIESIRYPRETTWIDYEYGKSGELVRVPGFIQRIASPADPGIYYTPFGAVDRTEYHNSTIDDKFYDDLMRITKNLSYTTTPYSFGESYKYRAHRLSQVYKQTTLSSSTKITELYYDYRDRIDSVGYLGEGEVAKYGYEYDKADNRVEVRKWVGGSLSSQTYYNYYASSDNLRNTSPTSSDTLTKYTYDAHGNTLTDVAKNLAYRYDYRQMLDTLIHVSSYFPAKRDTVIYGYNYLNQRVWKLTRYWYEGSCSEPGGGGEDFMEPGGGDELEGSGPGGGGDPMNCPHQAADLSFYVWSGDEVIAEYDMADTMKSQYIYANGQMAVQLLRYGAGAKDTSYVHHDYAGNARLSTSRIGATNSLEYFDIWGESRQLSGNAGHNYRFIGRERDVLAWEDHHYLRRRFYNPAIGRFLTPDPITSGINAYTYCNQSPVMYNDRSGLYAGSIGAAKYWSQWYNLGEVLGDRQDVWAERDPEVPDAPMNVYTDVYGGGPSVGGTSSGSDGSSNGASGAGNGGGGEKKHPAPTNPDGTPKSPEGDVPALPDGHRWRRVDGSDSRPDKWVPTPPIPGQSQPGVSWDPEGHWDHDSGRRGGRTRWLPDGGGQVDHDNNPMRGFATGIAYAIIAAYTINSLVGELVGGLPASPCDCGN